jgi:hypothetical protein
MGKASSAKKVARAARAGGRRSAGPRQRNLLFPGAVALIVILGVSLITYAARDRKTDDQVAPVANQDHWHSAFGIYICDQFLPAVAEFESPDGIHTHGDGVIHIHPFTQNAAGDNATLGVFLEGASIELTNNELKVNGDTYKEGDDTCGSGADKQKGELVVATWNDVQSTDRNPARITHDFNDIKFTEDGQGYVIAFVPDAEDTEIPKPDSASNLATLGAADASTATSTPGGSTTSTPAGDGSTTTAGSGESTTTTTAGDSTTTTSGG